jgi:hypothetical protein
MRFVSASEISIACCNTCSSGNGLFLQPLRQRFAFQIFHHRIIRAILPAGIEECADVWMVQAGDGFRFALESLAQFGTIREMCGQDFDGDDAVRNT